MPGVGSLLASAQAASLADVLALLLEQGVPLDEAVLLAAGTVNDPATCGVAQSMADAVRRGEAAAPDVGCRNGLTPFMRWMIANGQNERTLVPLVRHTAQIYRQRGTAPGRLAAGLSADRADHRNWRNGHRDLLPDVVHPLH